LGRGALVVTFGGFINLLRPKGRLLRPPGALPEDEFLAVCIRCDKCLNACPYRLVTRVSITESIIAAGTPVVRGSTCPNCRRCIPYCPVGALVRNRF
jgi:ferredoxin-type protein NapG